MLKTTIAERRGEAGTTHMPVISEVLLLKAAAPCVPFPSSGETFGEGHNYLTDRSRALPRAKLNKLFVGKHTTWMVMYNFVVL